MRRGKGMCVRTRSGRCPRRNRWFLGSRAERRTVRMHGTSARVRLPRRTKGLDALSIQMHMRGFKARGRQWPGAGVSAIDYAAR
jgi:hypothetical protein